MLISGRESFACFRSLVSACSTKYSDACFNVGFTYSGACQALLFRERFLHGRFALYFFVVLSGLRISSLNHRDNCYFDWAFNLVGLLYIVRIYSLGLYLRGSFDLILYGRCFPAFLLLSFCGHLKFLVCSNN